MTAAISALLEGEDQFCSLADGRVLCYRSYGSAQATPLVLIAGLGLQLTYWPPALVRGLVDSGYRVLIFDNRDVGRSSRISQRPPARWRQLLRIPDPQGYDIGDMAADLLALLDQLGIAHAHLVGMSMGGMIAQTFAARYPSRTLSLVSIFSTTGARKVGQPALSTLLMILSGPALTREQAIAGYQRMMRHIGPTRFVLDALAMAAYAGSAWDRGGGTAIAAGVARQIGAIMKSGDRTPELARISAPTLVIHGDRDLLVASSGGYATANAVRKAELVIIAGMGHFIGDGVAPRLLDLITGHARRAGTAD